MGEGPPQAGGHGMVTARARCADASGRSCLSQSEGIWWKHGATVKKCNNPADALIRRPAGALAGHIENVWKLTVLHVMD